MYVTLSARAAMPDIFIVARANSPGAEPKLYQAGADRVVNPHQLGGAHMAALVTQPNVAEFLDIAMNDRELAVRIIEVTVPQGLPAGRTAARRERLGRNRHLGGARALGPFRSPPGPGYDAPRWGRSHRARHSQRARRPAPPRRPASDRLPCANPDRHAQFGAEAPTMTDGILSEPIDLDTPRRRGPSATPMNVEVGMVLEHRSTKTVGTVVRYVEGQKIVLRDDNGRDHPWRPQDAMFAFEGTPVALRKLVPRESEAGPSFTPSGSIDLGAVPARMARASRIYVEGIHDAELLEKVWGDDLRVEGIVVEQMEGADDLAGLVRAFQPGPRRRLGVLLDHLVDGSKESRIASQVDDESVLICGHPYVDIWQAIKPSTAGIEAWPVVPKGEPWKQGVLEALGSKDNAGLFWKKLLGTVSSYKDLETPIVTAVEMLIDFVAIAE